MLDIGDDDGPFAAQTVLDRLAEVKTILVTEPPQVEEPTGVQHVKTLLLANKCDLPGAADRLEIVREMFAPRFTILPLSLETGENVEQVRDALYKFLRVIRVYTKQPGKPADKTAPFTCPIGSTVVDMAALVHRDFADKLKTARIWGTGVFDGQSVARDHVLSDGDIVELHL
jgi:ribosome-interacting GTPase 1